MGIRAKMQVQAITEHFWSQGKNVKFAPQYDTSIPEDQRFSRATPSGSMELHIDNPAALAQLKNGAFYYIDIEPVPEPAPAVDPNAQKGDTPTS